MAENFNEFVNEQLETLDLYTAVIIRAHGDRHPEFMDIRSLFESIQENTAKIPKRHLIY